VKSTAILLHSIRHRVPLSTSTHLLAHKTQKQTHRSDKQTKQHRKMQSINASMRILYLLLTMASTTSAALRGVASVSEGSTLVQRDLMASVDNGGRGGAAGRDMVGGAVFNVRMELPQGGDVIVTTPSPVAATTLPPTTKPTVKPSAKPTASPTAAPTTKLTSKPTPSPTAASTTKPIPDGNRCPSSQSGPYWDLAKESAYAVPCTSNADCVDYETQYASTWGVACCNYPQCLCAVRDLADKDIKCLSV
jgi:hypothetical protein